jgi:hypothetical protein
VSSRHGSPRPKYRTRAQVRRVQIHHLENEQLVLSTDEILKSDDSMFRGLTPPPWPSDLIPHKKRPRGVEEIIRDDGPWSGDKLSEELDEMIESSRKKIKLPHHIKRSEAGPASGPADNQPRSAK